MTPICFFCKYFKQNFDDFGQREQPHCSFTGKFTHENNICDSFCPVSNEYVECIDETYEEFGY